MAYFKKEDAEKGQPEGSTSQAQGSDEMRDGNKMEIARDEKFFKIGHIPESSCTGLPQIHPRSVGVAVSRSARVLDEPNCSIVERIPSRSVTHLTSLIDLSGSAAACSTNYAHGGRILGKATAVALQVPASPLHEPSLTVSAVAASVVHVTATSRAYFPPLGNAESRLPQGEGGGGGFGRCTVSSSVVERRLPVEPRMERGSEQNGGNGAEAQRGNETRHVSIAQRLTELLQGRGEGDLLLQQTDNENGMLQWLQALDLQVMGACRADERLRPMLQLNVSCSGADDRLLAQLSQLFKPRELGMLFRCLCVPLVSIRVGKVVKQGTKLCPTSTRGHLSLSLLPCSDLRLSFVGDNGDMEKLVVLTPGHENTSVVIEVISADNSGRSFVLRLPGGKVAYFWQSEKSKLVGDELLSKMKDLLGRRPSLSQLTGIRESRLDSFATYLRTSFLGSTSSSTQQCPVSSLHNVNRASSSGALGGPSNASNASASHLRPSQRSRLGLSQPMMHGRLHSGNQGSLSPRAGAFKDGVLRNISSLRSVTTTREKLKRRIDVHSSISIVSTPNVYALQALGNSENCNGNVTDPACIEVSQSITVPSSACITNHGFGNIHGGENNSPLPQRYLHLPLSSINGSTSQQSLSVGESSFDPFAFHLPVSSRVPIANSSIFAPHYCPCPLRPSSLQYTITPPFLPSLSTEAVSLPPATSYFSVGSSSTFIPPLPLDLHNVSFSPISLPVPSIVNIPTPLQTSNLPSFLSDPVVRVPLPVSSFVTVPTPQQVSTFTPFFSDPIVHIPMIDFDSSGQRYLVSASPSISSAISPILPSLLSTLMPESGPSDEKDDTNALQLLTRLGFSSSWRGSEGENCQMNFKSGFPAGAFSFAASSRSEHQNEAEGSCSYLEVKKNTEEDEFPYKCSGPRSSNAGSQNHVHYGIPAQQSGPLVGMAPALLTNSSLSCLFDICQDAKPKLTTLVTGSRGLYGGSWDPVSSALLAGISQIPMVHTDANVNCLVRNNLNGTLSNDGLLRVVEESSSKKERSKTEEEYEDDSSRQLK